jgi:hypothetical protein
MGTVNPLPGRQMASCKESAKNMNNVIKTQFAGKNPFAPKRQSTEVDVTTLRVTTDKPKKRVYRNFKYDALFKDLDIGKALSCKSEDADRVAQALRNYIERNEKPWKVRIQTYFTKTTGRVFVLEMK